LQERNNFIAVGIHNSFAFIPAFSFRRILLLKNLLGENRRRLGFLGVGMRGCFVELNSAWKLLRRFPYVLTRKKKEKAPSLVSRDDAMAHPISFITTFKERRENHVRPDTFVI